MAAPYNEGDVVRIDGDGTEYEVVSTHNTQFTLQAKYELDEADISRVRAQERQEQQPGDDAQPDSPQKAIEEKQVNEPAPNRMEV